MVKRDGKEMIFFLVIMLISMLQVQCAELALRVCDVHGHTVKQIPVGQPLTVSVMIKGTDGKDLQPIIRTKPSLTLSRAGQNMTLVGNNMVAIQYIYRSRIDVPGTYTIGPATIVYQGNTIASNAVSVEAVDQPISSIADGRNAPQEVFFELSTSTRTAVVGQKIPISLTFYYKDKSVRVMNVTQPSSDQFILKGDASGVFGTQELHGVLYNFIRWDWYIIAQQAGRIVIPAHCVDYEREKKSSGRFGGLSFFFDSGYESKRTYSNAVSVTVEALPPHQGNVLAIGTFESARLSIEPSVAQEGHAMVLNLDITGDTQWETIKSPELNGIPDGLRCYDSKQYMRKDRASTKRFEYVVQGLKPGKWRIPAQEFTVFDILARKYKMLRTESVVVTIQKDNNAPTALHTDHKSTHIPAVHDVPVVSDDLLPINERGPWSQIPGYPPLALWLFVVLALMCVLSFGLSGGYRLWFAYRTSRLARTRSVRAFSVARALLQQAQKINNVRALYYIFIQLFADYYKVDRGCVTQVFIEQKIRASAVSEQVLSQWQEFFVHLSSHVFSRHTNTAGNQHLFTSAATWVDLWEKLL